jgi:alpha-methylacyl-CoA racemase
MPGFLDRVVVLDLSSVGPAARASRWLADYGARVVKVAPLASARHHRIEPPAHAYSGGRGTSRICIDLKAAAGREVLLRLSESADVLIESFRPGVVDRLGIGYDDVRARNERIVYCSTSGYGQTGARAGWAGHDLNYLAVSGFLAGSERGADGKPPLPGTTVADTAGGGLHATSAILAALVARSHRGTGSYLDVSVCDGMLALMALQLDEYLATGTEPAPGSAPLGHRRACYDVYPTADEKWVSVAAIEPRFWRNLCAELGLDQWAERQHDETVQDDIRADLTRVFAGRTRDEWVRLLAAADTCIAPVLSVAEVAADHELAARGLLASARHPRQGRLHQLAPAMAGAERGSDYPLPDPDRSDTDAVLRAYGFSAEECSTLLEIGAVA